MKKFLLVVFVFMFCSLNSISMATTQVSYNNAGARSAIRHGASTHSPIHNFGSNAAFSPRMTALAGQRNRAIKREKAMTYAMANQYRNGGYNGAISPTVSTAQAQTVSRFSKDYTISTPKSYTKNGVTYYN